MRFSQTETIDVKPVDHCYLCGEKGKLVYKDGQDYFFGMPGKWDMRFSPNCSLYWLDPRPNTKDIHKLYEGYYTQQEPPNKELKGIKQFRRNIKLALLNAFCGYALQEVDSRLTTLFSFMPFLKQYGLKSFGWLEGPHNTGKLLDFGCGNGAFLNKMREIGWHVTGIEFDSRSAEIARKHFGIEVFINGLEEVSLPENSYDAVTMNHVIEHLDDPLAVLKECQKILCVGGQIVITTPNAKSLGHKLFKRSWRGLEFPRHLFIHTPESLQLCIQKAGFEVLSTRTLSRSARWVWFVSHKVKEGKWPVPGYYKEKSPFLKIFGRSFQFIETVLSKFALVGEELLIIAKKRK